LFFEKACFPKDPDQSGHARAGGPEWRGDDLPPDARSGPAMGSNGNKGVYSLAILRYNIYTLFSSQILYPGDSAFSSSFSGVFPRLIFIKRVRMAVPVLR
jgi:hypothetical protein